MNSSTDSLAIEQMDNPATDTNPDQTNPMSVASQPQPITTPATTTTTNSPTMDNTNPPKFTDPPALEHPLPAWVINRTKNKQKKPGKHDGLRLPSRPSFAPPPRKQHQYNSNNNNNPSGGSNNGIVRPSPHTNHGTTTTTTAPQHMFTPRAIEALSEFPSHEQKLANSFALQIPAVSYKHAPVRPAIGQGLKPFPYKVGSEKYLKPTSPRLDLGTGKGFNGRRNQGGPATSGTTIGTATAISSTSTVFAAKSRQKTKALAASPKKDRTMSLESVNDDEEDGVPTTSSITATRTAATGNIDNPDYLRIDISKLPLEMFDSSEYERRSSPEQWLINQDTGVNEGTTTGKSMYWVNGAWSWRGCDVLSYDSIGRKYTIRFRGSQRLKKVKRINLRFDHEDYATFDARVKAAKTKREQCKARLRLRHYMQDMPVEDVRPVRGSILKAICRRIAMPQVSGGKKVDDERVFVVVVVERLMN